MSTWEERMSEKHGCPQVDFIESESFFECHCGAEPPHKPSEFCPLASIGMTVRGVTLLTVSNSDAPSPENVDSPIDARKEVNE